MGVRSFGADRCAVRWHEVPMRIGGFLLLSLLAAGTARGLASAPRPAAPILFTPLNERGAALSPDGRTLAFTVRLGDGYRQAIFLAHRTARGWSAPKTAPFSGIDFDADPSFAPDGKSLLFASDRPADGKAKEDFDLWRVQCARGRWGTPAPIPDVNGPASETSPVLTRAGTLYFASTRGGGDIYRALPKGGGFAPPERLDDAVNSGAAEVGVAVDPDEKLMVVAAIGRDDEVLAPGHLYARGDLYFSRHSAQGWSPARRLPAPINSMAMEASPAFAANGRLLLFMSERGFATDQRVRLGAGLLARRLRTPLNGRGNIYTVPTKMLEAAQ